MVPEIVMFALKCPVNPISARFGSSVAALGFSDALFWKKWMSVLELWPRSCREYGLYSLVSIW
jgi:hypothetical protein